MSLNKIIYVTDSFMFWTVEMNFIPTCLRHQDVETDYFWKEGSKFCLGEVGQEVMSPLSLVTVPSIFLSPLASS